jgi:hypothetical protein
LAGPHEDAIIVIHRPYVINTTTIRSHQGLTQEITIHAGDKQGCPLSRKIFNLTMEPVTEAIT